MKTSNLPGLWTCGCSAHPPRARRLCRLRADQDIESVESAGGGPDGRRHDHGATRLRAARRAEGQGPRTANHARHVQPGEQHRTAAQAHRADCRRAELPRADLRSDRYRAVADGSHARAAAREAAGRPNVLLARESRRWREHERLVHDLDVRGAPSRRVRCARAQNANRQHACRLKYPRARDRQRAGLRSVRQSLVPLPDLGAVGFPDDLSPTPRSTRAPAARRATRCRRCRPGTVSSSGACG